MKQTAKKYGPHGRPPAGKNGDKREHILDSALNLFAGQGIAGTTIAQVAKAAGVTPAMVHYYFTNREGLLDAMSRLDETTLNARARVDGFRLSPHSSPCCNAAFFHTAALQSKN